MCKHVSPIIFNNIIMTGGLLQIVTHGSQDLFLTGNPEITYFKIVYRRHTNFSMEAMLIDYDDLVGFGTTSHITIPKLGDLVHNAYLVITLPKLNFTRDLDQSEIDLLTQQYELMQTHYTIVKDFMSVNKTAFRTMHNLYLSNNVNASLEMMNAITNTFAGFNEDDIKNLISNDTQEYDGIVFRYENIMMGGRPQLGNICLKNVMDYWDDPSADPSTISKDITMNIANFMMANCKYLDMKYFTLLNNSKKQLHDAYNTNYKFAWVDKLGHSIIDYIEFYIGGNKIDRHTGQWIDIWHELMGKRQHEEQYKKIIGDTPILTNFDRNEKPEYELKIPLQFFFNKFSGLSLPLVALQYNNVSFNVKFRKFSECAYIEGDGYVNLNDMLENKNVDITSSFLIEYIFLDSNERRIFAQSSHEYLIHQLQVNYDDNLIGKHIFFDINFEHPCIGLIWVLQRNSLMQNIDGHTKCYWTKYVTNVDDITSPIYKSKLSFNNYVRIEDFHSTYHNFLQPLMHCKNSPSTGINCYWFSLFPYEFQPSGSCNLSKIPKVRFEYDIDPFYFDNNETYTITVFALNYNILRILGGMGNVAYVI